MGKEKAEKNCAFHRSPLYDKKQNSVGQQEKKVHGLELKIKGLYPKDTKRVTRVKAMGFQKIKHVSNAVRGLSSVTLLMLVKKCSMGSHTN